MQYVIENVKVNENILDDETYQYLYSVEEVNSKVKAGMPFRDAYKEVATGDRQWTLQAWPGPWLHPYG